MNLFEESEKYLFPTYARFPVALVKGQGCRVWDEEGKEYLDFVAGIAVCNLGHCHPAIVDAVTAQVRTLIHVSNLYHIAPQTAFARVLVESSFADKVFFCNSGAEANEGAIKLARKYMRDHFKQERFEIIAAANSFHGRTMATLSATGQEKVRKGFEPLVPGFVHVPFNNMAAVEEARTDKTAAVFVEPIQGEGGVVVPDEGYLHALRAWCDRHELLLIFDEIQTGMGRTGALFCYEHDGVTPDIMTLAKGLAGGLPIGAVLASDQVAASLGPGSHASTFGGNPLATVAGLAAFSAVKNPSLLKNCRSMGAYLVDELARLKEKHQIIKSIRGRGLLLGAELSTSGSDIVLACMEKGLLLNCVQDKVLRFIPPLVVTTAEIDQAMGILDEVLTAQSGA